MREQITATLPTQHASKHSWSWGTSGHQTGRHIDSWPLKQAVGQLLMACGNIAVSSSHLGANKGVVKTHVAGLLVKVLCLLFYKPYQHRLQTLFRSQQTVAEREHQILHHQKVYIVDTTILARRFVGSIFRQLFYAKPKRLHLSQTKLLTPEKGRTRPVETSTVSRS